MLRYLISALCLTALAVPATAEEKFPFPVGETLYYKIHWNQVAGGHAKVSIKEKVQWKGREVLVVQTEAKTVPTVDVLFKVRDTITTYYDWKNRRPLVTVKELNEGLYRRRYKAYFNWDKKCASFNEKAIAGQDNEGKAIEGAEWKTKSGTVCSLPALTQDVLSAMMYMRSSGKEGRVGEVINIPFFDDGKLTTLQLVVKKKTTFSNAAGSFKALVAEPKFETSGLFKYKGTIKVWVSEDENRYPLKVEASVPIIGAIAVELVSIRN